MINFYGYIIFSLSALFVVFYSLKIFFHLKAIEQKTIISTPFVIMFPFVIGDMNNSNIRFALFFLVLSVIIFILIMISGIIVACHM